MTLNFRVACNLPWALRTRNGVIVPNAPSMPCAGARAAELSVQHEASLFGLGGRALEHWDLLFLDQLQGRREESEQRHRRAVRVQPPRRQRGGEDSPLPKVADLLEVDDLRTLAEHAVYIGRQLGRELPPLLRRWSTLRCCKGREVTSSHMQPLPCAHRGPTRYL